MQERANQPKQKIEYNFDVTKHIRLVPHFQEKEVDNTSYTLKCCRKRKLAKKALDLTSAKCFDRESSLNLYTTRC